MFDWDLGGVLCFDISSEYFEYIDVHQAFLCNQVPEKMMLKCKNYFS